MFPSMITRALSGAALLWMPAGALAQSRTAQPTPDPLFAAEPLQDEALLKIAGREDTRQASFANQTAGVSNSGVGDNVRNGEARISDNAFQNMSGLSIVNVNTGNNVAINAAMNVNIAITPGPGPQ